MGRTAQRSGDGALAGRVGRRSPARPVRSAAMSVFAGPLFALALLLGAAGVAKLAQPDAAVRAMATAGLPVPTPAVRVLGAGEVLIAALVLVYGGRLAGLAVAVAYAAFAAFSQVLLARSEATASCGCFGVDSSSPVSRWHVGLNVVAAVVALAAAIWPTDGLPDVLADQPLTGLPFLALTVIAGWLLFAAYTLLPDLFEAVDDVRADAEAAA